MNFSEGLIKSYISFFLEKVNLVTQPLNIVL